MKSRRTRKILRNFANKLFNLSLQDIVCSEQDEMPSDPVVQILVSQKKIVWLINAPKNISDLSVISEV